jgi:glycosyltransferase involved in cell wall biosynthesis
MQRFGCEVTVERWGHRDEQESLFRKLWDRSIDLIWVRRVARGGRYDVIVIKTHHDWRTLTRDIPLLLATRGVARKQVIQFQGSNPDLLMKRGHRAFKVASRILVSLSDAMMVLSKEEQRDWMRFSGSRQVYVVANPLVPRATAADSPGGDIGEVLGAPLDGPILLFVGRLVRAKGIYELVEAAAQLQIEHPGWPWCLVMAGDGPEADALRGRIEALGLAHRTHLVGYLDEGPLHSLYRHATVLVLPTYAEGFPTVITEAMSAGLPIITTGIRGAADRLEDGTNALFVRPRDSVGLFKAMERLLQDGALRSMMSEANIERVRVFSPDVVGQEYVSTLLAISR